MRTSVLLVAVALVFVTFITLTSPRTAAAALTAQVLGPRSVQLDWIPECVTAPAGPPCNGYATTSYRIYLKNGTYQSYWEYVDTIDNVAVTSYTIIGLQPSTAYQFRVDEDGWFGTLESNVATVTTDPLPPPPNGRPSLAILKPAAGETLRAGAIVTIEWTVSDDRDPPGDLVVYLNYTGPASGRIAGPISGETTRLAWTVPAGLRGAGFRILGAVFDAEGAWRPAEGPEFAIAGGADPPGPPSDLGWRIVTAVLSVGVAGLTAGLLLSVRVQLGDWYRRKREARKERRAGLRPPSGW